MALLIQDGVVTCAAIAAASIILRRVLAFARPSAGRPPCGSCGSQKSCASTAKTASTSAPLLLHGSLARRRRA